MRFFWVPAVAGITTLLIFSSPLIAQPSLTVIHPAEGAELPDIKEAFVYGAVTPGSALTINGATVTVHPQGGYLVMVPVHPGNVLVHVEAKSSKGETASLDRRFSVAPGFVECPFQPLTLLKDTVEPSQDVLLAPGDTLPVTFQGSPQGKAWFSVEGVASHVPMDGTAQGVYEGEYVIQADDHAREAAIAATLKGRQGSLHAIGKGHLTIDHGTVPRVGVIKDEIAAVRTGWDGGYDFFLYRGMRVPLTGKIRNEWRVRLASLQSGWMKEEAVQELPPGTPVPRGRLANITLTHGTDSTLVRIPLTEMLPYRTEQSLHPAQLVLTVYGAVGHTDFIRFDPQDSLIEQVRWKQTAPDTCQIIIEPAFHTWWGYDVRYEGTTLVLEVRKPWARRDVRGMVIALDPGHGGPEPGAIGPHATREKDANLEIARMARTMLEGAGAQVVMTRNSDVEVPLYERPKIAWQNRARLFVSIHCNASGEGENPLLHNGYSVYWYHPQSLALASAVHAQYDPQVHLPDRGLYYDDLAVCRMTQMPAILTEQAFIIVPEQEQILFNPASQKKFANAIVNGIKRFVSQVSF